MSLFNFLKHYITRPLATGAVAPSSNGLAELITDTAGVQHAKLVIEFGTGNGVFTEKVLQKIPSKSTFFAVEINPDFARQTRLRCPSAVVYEDSAVNTKRYMETLGFEHCDSIVCGLPWASFGDKLQDDLLHTIQTILKPGGVFATFAYLQGVLLPTGLRFRRKLKSSFKSVETTRTVWLNIPPAFVYKAVK